MKSDPSNAAPSPREAFLAFLADQRAAKPERLTTTLPVSGAEVSYPALLKHDTVLAASKMCGKKNRHAVGKTIISQTCLFNGARLRADEVGSLLDNADVQHLTDILFPNNDEDAEEGSGGAEGEEDGAGN